MQVEWLKMFIGAFLGWLLVLLVLVGLAAAGIALIDMFGLYGLIPTLIMAAAVAGAMTATAPKKKGDNDAA